MIRTIAVVAAAATLVTFINAGAQAAKNNPKFQAELINCAIGKCAIGTDLPAKPAASTPDVTGQIPTKVQ